MKSEIQVSEDVIRALIKSIGLRNFTLSLSNAFYQGKVLTEMDLFFNDVKLGEIYEHVDCLVNIAKKIEP